MEYFDLNLLFIYISTKLYFLDILNKSYVFSFTASSTRLDEFIKLSQELIKENYIFSKINHTILEGNKESTSKRKFTEYKKRLENLTEKQIQILVEGSLEEKKQITFLSICKTYNFIKDFVLDIVLEKRKLFDYQITDFDYNKFVSSKIIDHPELDEISTTTKSKIKQVLFLILKESGIINSVNDRIIQPQIISVKVKNVIEEDNEKWLELF